MPTVVITGAPPGQTPRLRPLVGGARVSMIIGIAPVGEAPLPCLPRRVRSPQVIPSLRRRLDRIPRGSVVFGDRRSIRTSKRAQHFFDDHRDHRTTHLFPSCAPEVRPPEQVGRPQKYVERRNLSPTTREPLVPERRARVERILYQPALFVSFFEHAGRTLSPTPRRFHSTRVIRCAGTCPVDGFAASAPPKRPGGQRAR